MPLLGHEHQCHSMKVLHLDATISGRQGGHETEEFHILFNAIPEAAFLWVQQHDGTIVLRAINRAMSLFSRGAADAFVGRRIGEVFDKDEWTCGAVREVLRTGRSMRREAPATDHLARARRSVWEMTRISGNAAVLVIRMIDVSRSEIERSQRQEQRYRTVLGASPDAIYLVAADGTIEMVNRVAVTLSGCKGYDELVGRSVYDFVTQVHKDDAREFIRRVLREAGPVRTESIMTRVDGTTVDVELRAAAIVDPEDGLEAVVLVVRDMSDWKRRGTELRYARERAMLYLDILGHDIRNQLQVIVAAAEIVEQGTRSGPVSESVQRIKDATSRCATIIGKVEATEGLSALRLVPRDMCDVVTEAVRRTQRMYPDVTIGLVSDVEHVVVDADRFLDDILMNLLDNAVRHNPGSTEHVWVTIHMAPKGGVVVSIADNGRGIPDPVKRALLGPARRYGGVSLHQIEEIVHKYGGRLTIQDRIEGRPDMGAMFQVRLPASSSVLQPSPPSGL